jgi:hypothetical protein
VVCGAAFTINLATTAVNIALPTLSRELTASTQQLLSVLAMAAPVYTIIEAPTRGWARMSTLGGFAAIGGFCADDFFRPSGAHCPWPGVRHFPSRHPRRTEY